MSLKGTEFESPLKINFGGKFGFKLGVVLVLTYERFCTLGLGGH